eukprot:269142_1
MESSLFVAHLETDEKCDDDPDSHITAIGACRIPSNSSKHLSVSSSDDRFSEICALTLERLVDCESVGILLFSETPEGQSLQWKATCAPQCVVDPSSPDAALRKAILHKFDFTMLKAYIKHHGAKYTKCPLCKRGTQAKQHILEHDIDSMAQLQEKRLEHKKRPDLQMLLFTESLMIRKACEEDTDKPQNYADVITSCLKHWLDSHVIEQHTDMLADSVGYAIRKDHVLAVSAVLAFVFGKDAARLEAFLVEACSHCSMDTVKLLVGDYNAPMDRHSKALKEAVMIQNSFLIDYLIQAMKLRQAKEKDVFYHLRDVFTEVIKNDLVDVARTIIEARWYSPNDTDLEQARSLDGSVGDYLESRLVRTDFRESSDLDLDDWDEGKGNMDDSVDIEEW